MAQAVLIHEDTEYCLAVQARMERLYKIDGRDNRDHPQHGIYTGLAAKYSLSTSTN
jgi:hypothetical protein